MVDAAILDELGYLPFPASSGALLLHLISQLYEKTSLIITTNLSFGEWVQVFGDAKNDHGVIGPRDPSLRYSGNRERFILLQVAKRALQAGQKSGKYLTLIGSFLVAGNT